MAAGWVTKPPGEAEALIGGGSNITYDHGPVGARGRESENGTLDSDTWISQLNHIQSA